MIECWKISSCQNDVRQERKDWILSRWTQKNKEFEDKENISDQVLCTLYKSVLWLLVWNCPAKSSTQLLFFAFKTQKIVPFQL